MKAIALSLTERQIEWIRAELQSRIDAGVNIIIARGYGRIVAKLEKAIGIIKPSEDEIRQTTLQAISEHNQRIAAIENKKPAAAKDPAPLRHLIQKPRKPRGKKRKKGKKR